MAFTKCCGTGRVLLVPDPRLTLCLFLRCDFSWPQDMGNRTRYGCCSPRFCELAHAITSHENCKQCHNHQTLTFVMTLLWRIPVQKAGGACRWYGISCFVVPRWICPCDCFPIRIVPISISCIGRITSKRKYFYDVVHFSRFLCGSTQLLFANFIFPFVGRKMLIFRF